MNHSILKTFGVVTLVIGAGLVVAALAPVQPVTTVIAHSPSDSGNFIGSPSIVVLDSGAYVVSHDFFGEGSKADSTAVYRSEDRGKTWQPLGELADQFWSGLFQHRGQLYLLGTRGQYGPVVIRRSGDEGTTWTDPIDADHGLLTDDRPYHGAAVPVLEYEGRLWRGFEFKGERVLVLLSAQLEDDLLEQANWHQTELSHPDSPSTWLEGNLVVTPDGDLASILRREFRDDTAVLVRFKPDGTGFQDDPQVEVIDFPGGGSKFTIRFDPQSERYWSLVNQQTRPEAFRNHLVLISSSDLRSWRVERQVAYHPDSERYSWQYADWQIDGNDMVAVLRVAGESAGDKPLSAYYTNLLSFLRIENFRTAQD